MLRVMLTAGQFAHVTPDQIESALDDLYDPSVRFDAEWGRNYNHHGCDDAVPYTLVKADQAGFLTERCYDCQTIHYFGRVAGIVCCLCLEIESERAYFNSGVGWSVPDSFVSFVCPTYLRAETTMRMPGGMPVTQSGIPMCGRCIKAVGSKLWRDNGGKWLEGNDALYLPALTWLLTNPSFRKRIERNAGNLSRLRFDPRKAA